VISSTADVGCGTSRLADSAPYARAFPKRNPTTSPSRPAGETMAALAADYEVGEATIFRALQGPFEQAA
jgi:hypothetical protein